MVEEGAWPWMADFVLSGARYDPDVRGAVAIPPQPRLFVLRRFETTLLPVFRTPQGDTIPASVTACGRFVVVDLDIDRGTVIVEDIARSGVTRGKTETFVIRSGLPAATRRADLIVDAHGARLEHDSDAVAIRIDNLEGTQTVGFNGPYLPLPGGGRNMRVVALYADRTEEVIFSNVPPVVPGHALLVLCLSLLGVVVLVGWWSRAPHSTK